MRTHLPIHKQHSTGMYEYRYIKIKHKCTTKKHKNAYVYIHTAIHKYTELYIHIYMHTHRVIHTHRAIDTYLYTYS